ncbi:hypothetical protein EVAR_41955_1 [Eumeta japonica]|uniref:Uncharacterized protein n=1 Tax=Eumeta variegata TaxID=151549 RepID=A0A4C1WTT5_EUMVA|nr:hypothetical protein EVAR_41955_1 [Eumeta japonica]
MNIIDFLFPFSLYLNTEHLHLFMQSNLLVMSANLFLSLFFPAASLLLIMFSSLFFLSMNLLFLTAGLLFLSANLFPDFLDEDAQIKIWGSRDNDRVLAFARSSARVYLERNLTYCISDDHAFSNDSDPYRVLHSDAGFALDANLSRYPC